jgi:hypothetical protein
MVVRGGLSELLRKSRHVMNNLSWASACQRKGCLISERLKDDVKIGGIRTVSIDYIIFDTSRINIRDGESA